MSRPAPDAGTKRAAEISEAMLGVPGYADDSMMFVVRYGDRCKRLLRKADYDALMAKFIALGEVADQDMNGDADGPDAAGRAERKVDLEKQAREIVSESPELERDFEQFIVATRTMTAAMNTRQSGS